MTLEFTFVYVLSQIFTIISYALLGVSYLLKSKRAIVAASLLSPIAILIAYILLGAWTGLAMCIIASVRNLYIFWDEKKHGKRKKLIKQDYIFLAVICLAIIITTIPSYDGPLSLLSVFSTLAYTYALWQKSPKVYKLFGGIAEACGLGYCIFIGSIFGVLAEICLLVMAIVGFITEPKKRKRSKNIKRGHAA